MFERLKSLNLETVYLYPALVFGLIMLFLNPPFQVPDEPAHYFKSLAIASGQIRCSGEPGIVPENYVSLPDDTKLVKIKGEDDKKVSGSKLFEALTVPASSVGVSVPTAICGAHPAGHLLQAIGLKLGLMTNAPPLVSFYLGRLLVFLAAVTGIYFAIRIAPFGKIIFVMIGLLPSVVQQLSSVSYDALHISFILLFTAYILKLASDPDRLTVKQGWTLLGLSLLALNVKSGYLLLSFLVLLLKKSKFQGNKKYWMYATGFITANILFFLLLRFVFSEPGAFPKGIDPNAQAMGVLKDPLHFLYAVFHSLYKGFFFYFETFFLKPGWLKTALPDLWYIFMAVGMVLILRSKEETVLLDSRQRLVLLGTFLAQFILVFLSLYLVWTQVGNDRVSGVQGRYLLAIAPLIIFSIYKSKFRFKSEWIRNNIPAALFIFLLISFFFVFRKIVEYYYKDISSYF